MRIVLFLLRKEFKQILRNRALLALVIIIPILQLILLPLAADYEIKNINIVVIDQDHSSASQKLIGKIRASPYFRLTGYSSSYKAALKLIESDEADIMLEIPPNFERNLMREKQESMALTINAINGTKATIGGSYLSEIIQNDMADLRMDLLQAAPLADKITPLPQLEIRISNWFNSSLNYHLLMVPGVLAILVTLIGGFLSALNIVREKEMGTIEQINVTPIKKHHFILGKLIPFWALGNGVFTLGLLLSWLVYSIVPVGSLVLLYGFIGIYLLAVLGLGLLVSSWCDTQQQAMFIMFFLMIIFILMSGLFTSIDSMPAWAQVLAAFNPVTYLIEVMRMVVLKGSSFKHVLPQLGTIAAFALVLNLLAIFKYKKMN